MTRAEIIEDTLVRVADVCGDPRDLVYARLFATYPEFEALFFMDTDGGVRGSMLQQGLECLMDFAGPRVSSRSILVSECQRHEGYGVPPASFAAFFEVIRDAFREALGGGWTPEMERTWAGLIAEMAETAAAENA